VQNAEGYPGRRAGDIHSYKRTTRKKALINPGIQNWQRRNDSTSARGWGIRASLNSQELVLESIYPSIRVKSPTKVWESLNPACRLGGVL